MLALPLSSSVSSISPIYVSLSSSPISFSAAASSVFPSIVMASLVGEVITLNGFGLQPSTSVRAVRFEPGATTCTPLEAGPIPSGTLSVYASTGSIWSPVQDGTVLRLSTPSPGFTVGFSYQTCIDYSADPVTGNYVPVGPPLQTGMLPPLISSVCYATYSSLLPKF